MNDANPLSDEAPRKTWVDIARGIPDERSNATLRRRGSHKNLVYAARGTEISDSLSQTQGGKIKFLYSKENRQTEIVEFWFCEINKSVTKNSEKNLTPFFKACSCKVCKIVWPVLSLE